MTKVLWHSVAPWCATGYGQQTALFAPKLAVLPDVDLAISTGFGLAGGPINWGGIHVYPSPGAGNAGVDWSRNALQWAVHHGAGEPCTAITLMDVWPLDPHIFAAIEKQGRLACWTPVDHKPAKPSEVAFLKQTNAIPVAMSRYGEAELRAAGLDPLYVPHGIDTEVFQPRERAELRDLLNFPEDAFVVGMVANNQGQSPPRKAFPEAFRAFKVFSEIHENAILYLHCEMYGLRNGIDLFELAERYEIPERMVRYTDQVVLEHLFPPGALAGLYNSFDVLLNPSYGEGFGIPIIEAQACGTPVIVTDWTAMPELVGAGWKVGGVVWDHPMAGACWLKPDIDELVDALEKAYASRGDEQLRTRAREFAVQYDADKVMEDYWKPALEAIHKPREVQPLKQNRAMRRAKSKAAA